ncbi:MAG: hypothetical protein HYS25_05380 [Ignavibacteriales bacterium]|nr:hypothetical protein [Ignavibacteriales bacterium]
MRKLFPLIVLIALISTAGISAQSKNLTIGKIFTNQQANELYGPVLTSVQISKEELGAAVAKAKKYVLFAIKDGKAFIMDERKVSLTGDLSFLAYHEKANAFSKSVVERFLSSSSNTITFEQRETVFTVSSSESTTESSLPCPPMCPY